MDARNTSILSGTAGGDLTGSYPSPTVKSFREIEMAGEGIISETGSRLTANSSTILVSQSVYLMRIALKAGTTVTNMVVAYSASGATLTTVTGGLYDKTAQFQLATTVNSASSFTQTTATAANMRVSMALSAAFAITASDVYYAALYCNGTTPPTIVRHANQSPTGLQVGSGVRIAVSQSGVGTSLPATVTLADAGSGTIPFWMAIT